MQTHDLYNNYYKEESNPNDYQRGQKYFKLKYILQHPRLLLIVYYLKVTNGLRNKL